MTNANELNKKIGSYIADNSNATVTAEDCLKWAVLSLKAIQENHHIIPKDELVVLEEGAEVQVGDVIIDDVDEAHVVIDVINGTVKWNTDECYEHAPSYLCKIIQRNGIPVIQK